LHSSQDASDIVVGREAQYLDKQPNSTFQMPQILDVQGFSHVNDGIFKDYHAAWPSRPLVASECCSCLTQYVQQFRCSVSGRLTGAAVQTWRRRRPDSHRFAQGARQCDGVLLL